MACIVFVLNGGKNQNPQNSLELQTKAKLSLDQNLRSSKNPMLKLPEERCGWDTRELSRNFRLFWEPKKSLLKSSDPKNTCQNFPTQKNPKIKTFKPKKILQSSLSLEIRSTPLGSCLIAEMLSTPGKVIRLSLCDGEDFKATWYGKEVATESLFV